MSSKRQIADINDGWDNRDRTQSFAPLHDNHVNYDKVKILFSICLSFLSVSCSIFLVGGRLGGQDEALDSD